MARTAYLVKYIPAQYEVYSAITYDSRWLSPAITLSFCGGMDIESAPESQKRTFPVNVYQGLDAYQAGRAVGIARLPAADHQSHGAGDGESLGHVYHDGDEDVRGEPLADHGRGRPVACDFKGVFDAANFKHHNLEMELPEYPGNRFRVSGGDGPLERAIVPGPGPRQRLGWKRRTADPVRRRRVDDHGRDAYAVGRRSDVLSDFGGNPPYEQMRGTAAICFKHKLADAKVLLVLGGKANNTRIDVTFQAIADALTEYAPLRTPNCR